MEFQTLKTPARPVRILDPLVAERIAAGEVIERPASVVKELVENSIDAGATRIEVELKKGGIEEIIITDNGCGMTRESLETSLCRHATSKIENLDDLMNLSSLGFRGEALPSIASVSDLTITSRAALHDSITQTFEAQAFHTAPKKGTARVVPNTLYLGSNHGTRVNVQSLFSRIPARLKFLKSPGAETSAIREIIEREAIAHPEVAFTLKSDGRMLLKLEQETFPERASKILSDDDTPFEVIHESIGNSSWSLEVVWLKGMAAPHTRKLLQVINHRPIRDRIFQQALLLPLKQSFLPGNFPVLAARLSIPAGEIDVNAHPTKLEVRFLESKKVFAITQALFDQLQKNQRAIHSEAMSSHTPSSSYFSEPHFSSSPHQDFAYSTSLAEPISNSFASSSPAFPDFHSPFGEYRGTLFSTYLLFEKENELLMVDQHAAHERIRYEALQNKALGQTALQSQQLLVPEVVKTRNVSLAQELTHLGFEAESFGEESIIVRAIPAVWGMYDLNLRIRSLIERLEENVQTGTSTDHPVWDEALFEKIAMEACRGSVKAGDRLSQPQAEDLVRKLFKCAHPGNCPHGRPAFIKVSKNKFDEWFQRIL